MAWDQSFISADTHHYSVGIKFHGRHILNSRCLISYRIELFDAEVITIFTVTKQIGYCRASYDRCVSDTRCKWVFLLWRIMSRRSNSLPTMTIAISFTVGAL